MKKLILILPVIIIVITFSYFSNSYGGPKMKKKQLKELTVKSSAFKQGEMIPSKYTCDGENISPDISWEGAPEGTESFVLISDDPDAPMGIWVHWVVFNIPDSVTSLPENVPPKATLKDGTNQGITSFKEIGYGGPCPPSGTHRYFFKVYAINTDIDLEPRYANKKKVLDAMEGHVLAYGELMGTYKR